VLANGPRQPTSDPRSTSASSGIIIAWDASTIVATPGGATLLGSCRRGRIDAGVCRAYEWTDATWPAARSIIHPEDVR
jgi:hypothetical protein